ncbi:protein-disulfide reductase DsbD family protein [Paramagnetospirillum marisnigri]|nr:protein-disulfide reductase DsbD domain-containing protein [Paramagnetospirillum marisnigri]
MRVLLAVLMLWLGMTAVFAAAPGESDWAASESGRVRLVAATTSVGQAAELRLGVQFQLQPGWKIYWRSPGDAGYPPRLDWAGSANLGEPAIRWPAPHRFVLAGLQNHGYVGEVVLPLDVPVITPGQPVAARLAVDFLACSQICVPQKAELALDLPAGAALPSEAAHVISRFAALVPGDGIRHGLALERPETFGEGDGAVLRLSLAASEPLTEPDAFVEAEEVAGFGQPRVTLSSDRRSALLEIPVTPGTVQKPLAGQTLRVTVTDGLRSLETSVTPLAMPAPPPTVNPPETGLWGMLAVALLGGLILNLMPCVLPVLSIKLLGILGHGGGERGHVRASFIASAAGIFVSFLALAALAIAVKQAGQAVGWGIQFQQPGFLAVMVVLLALFAANLWGAFEIPLPGWLMNAGGGGRHHTVLGHFLSGAFATVLATPCSAPFLGTAIGFALARGPVEIIAIFAALGLGMAAPFLAVALWPDAALRLPRPGRWMITVRKLLGLALAATGVWLLSVLAAQAGIAVALVSGGAVAGAVLILALKPRLPPSSRSAVMACVAALAGLAVAAPFHGGEAARGSADTGSVAWVAFDASAIPRLVGEGKVVFVDVTADWCITCKVNKAAVIERGPVAKRLGAAQTVAMKADWTRPDDGIARYLASFGRYGIPFNAVYGPAAPDGIALPELLSDSDVLGALDRAAGVGAGR